MRTQARPSHLAAAAATLVLVGAVTVLAPLPAQTQPGQAVFGETVDVEVINVEVVVTDKKSGEPVTGLTAGDFRLFENGEPVEITNFYEVAAADRPPAGPEAAPEQAPLPGPAGGTRDLNLVIFVDNLNMHPGNRKLLFDKLREYLRSSAGSIDRAMVVSMQSRVEVAQPFTGDMGAVLAALDTVEDQTSMQAIMDGEQKIYLSRLQRGATNSPAGGQAAPGGGTTGTRCGGPNFEDSIRVALDLANTSQTLAERRFLGLRATVSALNAFAATLGGLPGRKAMLYLSDGLSVQPDDTLREAWAEKYEGWYLAHEDQIRACPSFPDAAQRFQNAITGLGSNQFDLHNDLDRFGANASDNQVVLYPISVSGRASSIITAESSGSSGAVLRTARTTEAGNRDAGMLQMAADTGGVAVTSSPNVGLLLDRIAGDFGHYYSLGYRPGEARDYTFHKFKIEVDRPGVEVRYGLGRNRKTWRDRLGDMTAAAALLAIQTNPLDVRLTPGEQVRQGKRYKVPVMVQIPFQNIQMVSDGSSYRAELTVLVTVGNSKGELSDPQRFDLPIQIPNAQILAARAQAAAYPVELLMDSGAQTVAVAVRDHLGHRASVVSLPIQVGDSKAAKKKRKKRKG